MSENKVKMKSRFKFKQQSNKQPIFIDFEDLKEKLGYRVYKPRIGILGKALIKLSKRENQRSIGWLKHQLDELFMKNKRKKTRNKKDRNVKIKK